MTTMTKTELKAALEAALQKLEALQQQATPPAPAPRTHVVVKTTGIESRNAQPWSISGLKAVLRKLRKASADRRASYLRKCENRPLVQRRAIYRHLLKVDARAKAAITG